MSTTRLAALKAADHFIEFALNKRPLCPHCGAEYVIEEHEAWHLYDSDEGSHEVECGSCDLPFNVDVRITWSFSTDEQEEDE